METGLVVFRVFLGFCGVAIMALIMWGLRSGMYYMGQDFAVGFAAGFMAMFLLLWLHHWATGKNIFTS